MARALIGRTVRRLRSERRLTQQALAVRLGISASYLNLIEHDQRAVTASLLIKLGETLGVDLATLSGRSERQLEVALREAFADPLLSADAVPEAEVAELAAAAPNAARAVLALYRAWRVAREDAGGIALPSGPPRAAAQRRGARLVRRPRQPLPAARSGGRGDRRRTGRHAGGDEPRHRRTPAANARPDRDRAAAGRRAAPLRSGRAHADTCRRCCRAKAAASTWRSSLRCWRRARRWRRCWPMPRRPRRKPAC